jgi:hypothetical protein
MNAEELYQQHLSALERQIESTDQRIQRTRAQFERELESFSKKRRLLEEEKEEYMNPEHRLKKQMCRIENKAQQQRQYEELCQFPMFSKQAQWIKVWAKYPQSLQWKSCENLRILIDNMFFGMDDLIHSSRLLRNLIPWNANHYFTQGFQTRIEEMHRQLFDVSKHWMMIEHAEKQRSHQVQPLLHPYLIPDLANIVLSYLC